ncbi:MAG: pseudouridine synthase [Balneolaceae bacterium]
MNKKKRNNEEREEKTSELSAREILLKAGRKRSSSRVDKIRSKSEKKETVRTEKVSDERDEKRSERSDSEKRNDRGTGSSGRKSHETRNRNPLRSKRGNRSKKERSDSVSEQSDQIKSRPDRTSGRSDVNRNAKGRFGKKTSDDRGKKGRRRASSSSQISSQRVAQKDYLRDEIRLNKYIAHAGLCSRREADEYIEQGKVKVNGKVVTELGTKVKDSDQISVDNQKISLEPFVYILLNKGRDTISTTDDEKDRNTVVDAIEGATGHRVYPVGRLDRNTMGLLVLTNDGDLAHRLMHPSYQVKKTYEVTSSRKLVDSEIEELRSGITLEDGPIQPTSVKRDPMDAHVITITVFEGRNHLIRRMIGHLGADVDKLVRIRYAGLSDKNIRTGRWRYLKQKEINDLRRLVKLDTLSFNKDER